MKKILLVSAALMLAHVAFPQGQVVFDNIINAAGQPGVFPGAVRAPFYSQDPTCPTCIKQGNTSTGNPVGSTVYNGSLLFNDSSHSYTVTLRARNSTTVTGTDAQNNLNLVGVTTMRTSTSGGNAGRTATPPAGNPVVNDVVPGSTDRGTFQVRVWDSRGGTITTWDQVLLDNTIARGYSTLFTVPYSLTTTPNPPPNLEGLLSFQLFQVP